MTKKDFYLTDWQLDALKKIGEQTGLTVSALLRMAIIEFIRKEENKTRKSVKNQTTQEKASKETSDSGR